MNCERGLLRSDGFLHVIRPIAANAVGVGLPKSGPRQRPVIGVSFARQHGERRALRHNGELDIPCFVSARAKGIQQAQKAL